TRLAVTLARRKGFDLGGPAHDPADDGAALGLAADDLTSLAEAANVSGGDFDDPHASPWLRDFLVLAAENRRLREADVLRRAEDEADRLHAALERQDGDAAERL